MNIFGLPEVKELISESMSPKDIFKVVTPGNTIVKFSSDMISIGVSEKDFVLNYGEIYVGECSDEEFFCCILGLIGTTYSKVIESEEVLEEIIWYVASMSKKEALKNLAHNLSATQITLSNGLGIQL